MLAGLVRFGIIRPDPRIGLGVVGRVCTDRVHLGTAYLKHAAKERLGLDL